VPDPAEQLQAIYLAGFEIETFERFPNSVGLRKGNCIALVQVAEGGLKIVGRPGWRMGEFMGVLVERAGQRVFQAKSEMIEATPERISELESFARELEDLMSPRA
jgi:hypothetical protein